MVPMGNSGLFYVLGVLGLSELAWHKRRGSARRSFEWGCQACTLWQPKVKPNLWEAWGNRRVLPWEICSSGILPQPPLCIPT